MQQSTKAGSASVPSKSRASNRPAHTIRYGTIRAAIWRNVVDLGAASRETYGVTFSRLYKDDANQWRDSASFGPEDLLVVAKAADEAYSWIARTKATDAERE